ncbi:MAG: hypothetical protein EA382_03080 [Spirochaetaceae bacterium]|nr:MAG: hypothetical protein EA382_03080 [Spirochaetaceae bacterium]
MRDVLFERLAAAGLTDAYREENRKRQERVPDVNRKPGVFRSGRHKRMTRDQKREFERLYDIRDRHAQALDLPPNTVVANDDLFALAAGTITPDQIRGNRRLPDATLRQIRIEMAG